MPDAPQTYHEQIFKTTYLLLGYGLQITVTFPDRLASNLSTQNAESILLPDLLRGLPLSASSGKKEMQTPEPSNSAYSVLLAVLANKC